MPGARRSPDLLDEVLLAPRVELREALVAPANGLVVERPDRALPCITVVGHVVVAVPVTFAPQQAESISSSTGTFGSSSWPRSRSRSARAIASSSLVKNCGCPRRRAGSTPRLGSRRPSDPDPRTGSKSSNRPRSPGRDPHHRSRRRIDASSPMPPTSPNSKVRTPADPSRRCTWPHASHPGAARCPRTCRYVPCMLFARTKTDASGKRRLGEPLAEDATDRRRASTGRERDRNHIIVFPKLARSCSRKISSPVTSAPTPVRPASDRSNRPCSTSRRKRSMTWAPSAPPEAPGRTRPARHDMRCSTSTARPVSCSRRSSAAIFSMLRLTRPGTVRGRVLPVLNR